ncbi:MAG: hypothetical protein D3904_02800 [Candidatus Electrothrix sp. EH2]|nr:hypothetical protein [Candidatus Electrothrix sp. EH2]
MQEIITGAKVRHLLNTTALDIESAGFDHTTGAGIIMADAVLAELKKSIFPIAPLWLLLKKE